MELEMNKDLQVFMKPHLWNLFHTMSEVEEQVLEFQLPVNKIKKDISKIEDQAQTLMLILFQLLW